jgi:hypothetical protein
MKIGMTLTLDGLIRAMRWQGLAMAETKPAAEKRGGFVPVGEPARAVIERLKAKRSNNGL